MILILPMRKWGKTVGAIVITVRIHDRHDIKVNTVCERSVFGIFYQLTN